MERNGPFHGTLHLACLGYLFPGLLYTINECPFLQSELYKQSKNLVKKQKHLVNCIPTSDGFIFKWHSWGAHFQIHWEWFSPVLCKEIRHLIQKTTSRARFSTIKYNSCASKLDSKGHLALYQVLCSCTWPVPRTLVGMAKKRWLSLRQLMRLLCPSVPLTLPTLIFELFINQLLNHWSYLAL